MAFQFQVYLRLCLVLLLSFCLFSCAGIRTRGGSLNSDNNSNNNGLTANTVEEVKDSKDSKEQESKYVLTSVGYAPIAAQKGDSRDLQMLNAIKVSKLEAYKEMAEQVYGVLVNSENNVVGGRLQDDIIKSRVKGLVRGAHVLKSYPRGEVYITELELDMAHFPFF